MKAAKATCSQHPLSNFRGPRTTKEKQSAELAVRIDTLPRHLLLEGCCLCCQCVGPSGKSMTDHHIGHAARRGSRSSQGPH